MLDKTKKNKNEPVVIVRNYFYSKKGKRLLAGCAAGLVLFGCFRFYSAGSDLRKGIKCCKKENYIEAQQYLKKAVQNNNLDADAYYYLGMAYLGTKETDSARKQFQLAINLEGQDQEALRGLGLASYMDGKYSDAIEYFNKALDESGLWINDLEYDILWYRADAEKAMKDYEASAYTYGALLELESDSAMIRYYRGDSYCRLGMKEEALADFDAAVSKKGNGYSLYWNIYDSLTNAGWDSEAMDYLMLTTQDGYIDAKAAGSADKSDKYKGMIEYICGDYAQAKELLEQESLADDDEAGQYLALTYEALGKYSSAYTIYENQLKKDPDEADYNRMARFLIRQDRCSDAVSVLNRGIAVVSTQEAETLYYNLVSAYESSGDFAQAQAALDTYCASYGESEETRQEAAWLSERIREES